MKKIQTFIKTCLRRILRIRWPINISNRELWERTRQQPIEKEILQRRWCWICYTLQKTASPDRCRPQTLKAREKEAAPKHLATRLGGKIQENGTVMWTTGETDPGLELLENSCWWPMFQMGLEANDDDETIFAASFCSYSNTSNIDKQVRLCLSFKLVITFITLT